jgi:hypothetical protein
MHHSSSLEKNLMKIICVSTFPQAEVRASMPTSPDFLDCTTKWSKALWSAHGRAKSDLQAN